MGQQQLILLVLATVIIGIAIVVGIRAFTENDAKANADAMTQDAVRIANDIQAWVKKPQPFGGAAAAETWKDAEFADIGYTATGTPPVYTNLNGNFTLTDSGAAGARITGIRYEDGSTTAIAQQIEVVVCGGTDADINGGIITLNSQSTTNTVADCV